MTALNIITIAVFAQRLAASFDTKRPIAMPTESALASSVSGQSD